ncbi:MAG: hypothetical protein RTV72_14385 [Candidatus Thorarchaeota archaeon]
MKKPLVMLITTIMLLSLISMPTAAAVPTDQGLDWAVAQGDVFYYHAELYDLSESNPLGVMNAAEDIYMNLTDPLPTIPDDMTSYMEIPMVIPESFFVNGTVDSFFGPLLLMTSLGQVKPVGNWSLLGNLYEDMSPANLTVDVDDWLHWGFTMNMTMDMMIGTYPTFSADMRVSSKFLKTDGVLSALDYSVYNASSPSNNVVLSITAERDGVVPVVTSPDDISFENGTTGHTLNWSATDTSPAGYVIEVDGVEVARELWDGSSDNVTLILDDLGVGVHECEITFYEASGLYATDMVNVNITAPPTSTTGTDFLSQYLPIILVAGGLVVVIIIIIVVRKR